MELSSGYFPLYHFRIVLNGLLSSAMETQREGYGASTNIRAAFRLDGMLLYIFAQYGKLHSTSP